MELYKHTDSAAILKNLLPPKGAVDIVLDTDAANDIDDQFAIAYIMKSRNKINLKAIYAAPFFAPLINEKSASAADGMEKSYDEIMKVLSLMGEYAPAYKGAVEFLPSIDMPIVSSASSHLADFAMSYSIENPLYVVSIASLTNIASAILQCPDIAERIVVLWLGGHARHWPDTREFNLMQDILAARIVYESGCGIVQFPCHGILSNLTVSEPELRHWLEGHSSICDYLVYNTIDEARKYAEGRPWSRPIWDIAPAAWLIDPSFFFSSIEKKPTILSEGYYAYRENPHFMRYIYYAHRDQIIYNLFEVLRG